MAERTAAGIFGEVFDILAEKVTSDRIEIAKKIYAKTRDYDFATQQMEADDSLITLMLAHRGVDPKYPSDGEAIVYNNS